MHLLTIVWLMVVAVALAAAPASAQDADALRRELDEMRRSFETMRQSYEKAMDALNERIKRLEAAPAPAPPATAPAPPRAGARPTSAPTGAIAQTPPAPPAGGPPSALEIMRPREAFSLYGQRGTGALLFDMGLVGDFLAHITQRNVDKADAGTFPNRENRFFVRTLELNLFGQIDPYARADIRIEAGEETAGEDVSLRLSEAALTLLTLPYGTQAKLGQMRSRYGWSNQLHEDALPWPDRPGVYRAFFGEEGLVEKGGELTWVPDLPFYLEAVAGVFDGDNATAFGRGKLSEPLVTGRLRTFVELTDTQAIQLGVSIASGLTADRHRATLPAFDVRYKLRPDGWLHPLLTLGGEAIYSIRGTTTAGDVAVALDTDGDGIPDTVVTEMRFVDRTRHRFGWYTYGELQPWRRWALGARYDSTEFPENPGREWAIEPYLTFLPSDFLRFRLGYKHTERSHREGFVGNDATARIVDELLFQATFILGAHPAHPF